MFHGHLFTFLIIINVLIKVTLSCIETLEGHCRPTQVLTIKL